MTWEDYYSRFYELADSTQARYLSSLTSLGPADEVGEIIVALQGNIPASNRLLQKAVQAKLAFSGDDLVDFVCCNDETLAEAAVRNSAERLTAEDLENLYGMIDDSVIIDICRRRNLALPEVLREEEEEEDDDNLFDAPSTPARRNRPGLFPILLGIFAGTEIINILTQNHDKER